MSEFDDTLGDRSLRDAFENFRAGSLDTVLPEGPDAVRHTVRRRHRARVAAVAVVAALVVLAGGAGTLAAINPVGNTNTPMSSGSATAVPSGSASPSGKPRPSGSQSAGSAQDGAIGKNELMNATIDVPDWGVSGDNPCASGSGRLTFHDGEVDLGGGTRVLVPGNSQVTLPPVYFQDIDHDGARETVAVLWCGVQGGYYQAVALDRDADGNIVTLGQIATTANSNRPLAEIDQVAFDSDNNVQLHWVGRNGSSDSTGVAQWRTYQWTGSGFEQIEGPTAFPSPTPSGKVNLAVASPNVTMTANGDGTYGGKLSFTVTNNGDAPVTQFHLDFDLADGATWTAAGTGSSGVTCKTATTIEGACDYSGSLANGDTISVTVPLRTTSSTIPSGGGDINLRIPALSNYPITGSGFRLVAG